jgi:hypothetical protein
LGEVTPNCQNNEEQIPFPDQKWGDEDTCGDNIALTRDAGEVVSEEQLPLSLPEKHRDVPPEKHREVWS